MRTTLFEYPFHQTFCAAKLGKWPCDGNMSLFSTCWRGFWLHGMWTVGSPIMSPDDILTHRQDLVVTPKGTTYTDSSLYVYEMGTQRLLGLRPKGTQQFLQNKKNAGLHVSPIAWGLEYLECRTVAFKRCRPFPQAFRWWLILRMRMGMLFVSLLRMCFRSLPLRLLWFERHIVADATADKNVKTHEISQSDVYQLYYLQQFTIRVACMTMSPELKGRVTPGGPNACQS